MPLSQIPSQFLRSNEASPKRTLIDILRQTVDAYPNASAIDDGTVLTYSELWEAIHTKAKELHALGIRRGNRIGIRMPSGSRELYIAILATLAAGAAYVPVDADDPDERAELVFGEAKVHAAITSAGIEILRATPGGDTRPPRHTNDAWIIFTSGSTGTPKGVAITHRNAAAFIDAESALFLQNSPLGPDDRVLAGLSVAFDASCEEMWLAWAHGACLVPAPRSLVRSGMDLGPWLISRNITVVSTVPTLANLWPAEALDNVRLLIFGGEACPPELVDRVATADREVWNTYGPTEATVVACASRVFPGQTVSIGLPLQGWDLAVVNAEGNPVDIGQVGELVIAGVGLGRYLDEAKDKEKYSPLPSVGWARAYRSGDHVRLESDGLYFIGRVDDQVKIGGRRIELGEVESHVSALPNVLGACVIPQSTNTGTTVLVGYLSLETPAAGFDIDAAYATLSTAMPAPLVPRLFVMDELPVTTSGKVDKRALPWPLPGAEVSATNLSQIEQWVAEIWVEVLGAKVSSSDADFFALGGTSLAAATVIARVRERYRNVSVRDLYDRPRLSMFAECLDDEADDVIDERIIEKVPLRTRIAQNLIQCATMTWQGAQWVTWLMLITAFLGFGPSWQLVLAMALLFLTPFGRIPLAAIAIRCLTHNIQPGSYPRGGQIHLRIWAAEQIVIASGVHSASCSTLMPMFARLTGSRVGRGVDMHSVPPVTGLLRLNDRCAIEPEVDLSGYWLDGDILHIGSISIGTNARIGTRTVLMPDTVIDKNAQVEPGSTINGRVKPRSRWAGSPAKKISRATSQFPDNIPPRRPVWAGMYTLCANILGILPVASLAAGFYAAWHFTERLWAIGTLGAIFAFVLYALTTFILVRILSLGLTPGIHPVRSSQGLRSWAITRLMDEARQHLFPIYASQITPLWFRMLGARIGREVEISTTVAIPRFLEVKEGSFLADDTLVGGYALGHGWLLTGNNQVGKRSFLGNSGVLPPGIKLRKDSLVAVLSLTPKRSKAKSNWWGSPPERLRRVTIQTTDDSRTYTPQFHMKLKRACVESMRILAPIASANIAVCLLLGLYWISKTYGWGIAYALSGFAFMAAGFFAAWLTITIKWLCIGHVTPGQHPLWSSFIWWNELQDTFVEVVAAPWFSRYHHGTAALNWFLRELGAKIGRGAWIESYWFPEADLCQVGEGASIGPGCVVQTHLFQDRVMSLDTVRIGQGATLGPHSVSLPASTIGNAATVGPRSLVMRGDSLPPYTRWLGNPIEILRPIKKE
ncbi:Pls/PosA family non-ribosomal peptide synthetase [Corynebacterium freiburgense]|uniref:Pls/PosA family non-ribosomal peptide synthetase n=1 Tax=Corynebacterium freiburgense TaxID=556548 RepID=UPI00040A30DE|nr:Pls/PosA family non-ribosomal peptide synthetase [Corynebacterium freiburgense]WJZ03700.1 Plipastatin synthase subunit E [Corynebacterium freiburgense]